MKNRAGGACLFVCLFKQDYPLQFPLTFLHLEFVLVLGILHCVSLFIRRLILKSKQVLELALFTNPNSSALPTHAFIYHVKCFLKTHP